MDISVSNLTKIYDNQRAIDEISFEVKKGEIVGFLGPNGAGKTTTMKILTCFMLPTFGDVKIGEYSIYENPLEIKRAIGYLPENNPLYSEMNFMDYLNFSAAISGLDEEKLRIIIPEIICNTGLNDEKHKNIFELSKGYKQRVGLAQALIHDPEILILDEPTTGLDPNQIVEIRKLIRELGKHKTVVISSHILSEVEATCDRILIINKGKIVADGTAEMLKCKSHGESIIKLKLLDIQNQDTAYQILRETITNVEFDKTSDSFIISTRDADLVKRNIFNVCANNHWVISELTTVETKLEDIFRELTL